MNFMKKPQLFFFELMEPGTDMIFLNFLNVYPPGNYQMIFLFP